VQCIRFVVSGRVQGVGFRNFVARHARALGIKGFVRNRPGGEVEVVALAAPDTLDSFEQLLARGPVFASVAKVERQTVPSPPAFSDFQISF